MMPLVVELALSTHSRPMVVAKPSIWLLQLGVLGILFVTGASATAPFIIEVLARPVSTGDTTLGTGDSVDIRFNVITNWGTANVSYPDAASLAWVQPFNLSTNVTQSFGTSFSGSWVAADKLRITFNDVAGCTVRPRITAVRILVEGGLRNSTNNSAVSTAVSSMMTGQFVDFRVTEALGVDNGSPNDFQAGDLIVIRFSMPTTYAVGSTMTVAEVMALFSASNFGSNYNANWTATNELSLVYTNVGDVSAVMGVPLLASGGFLQDAAGLSDGNLNNMLTAYPVELGGGWKTGTCTKL